MKNKFSFSDFSKYRDLYMGIAIIGVVLAHSMTWSGVDIDNYLGRTFALFARSVYTRGFLLLSGLGLFYSFSKNGDVVDFYKKRVSRLIIPFVVLSLPFYFLRLFVNGDTIIDFILNITTLKFWVSGDYGMWYISVSLLLYIVFPLIYKWIYQANTSELLKTTIAVILYFIVASLSYSYIFDQRMGIMQIPMFLIGIYAGYKSYNEENPSIKNTIIYLLLCLFFLFISGYIKQRVEGGFYLVAKEVYEDCTVLLMMFVYALLFHVSENKHIFTYIKRVLSWFGKYTLEIYILHMLFHYLFDSFEFFQLHPYVCVASYIVLSLCLCKYASNYSKIISKKIIGI